MSKITVVARQGWQDLGLSDSGSPTPTVLRRFGYCFAERAAARRVVVQLMPLRDPLAALRTPPIEAVERSRCRVAAKAQVQGPLGSVRGRALGFTRSERKS